MTILTAPVTADETTFVVSDDSLLSENDLPQTLQIASEKFSIVGYEAASNGNTRWYVERGVDGSIAASHSGGVAITVVTAGGGGGVSVTGSDGTGPVAASTARVPSVVDAGGGIAVVKPAVISATDPGAIGAGNLWVQSDPSGDLGNLQLWVRDPTDAFFIAVGVASLVRGGPNGNTLRADVFSDNEAHELKASLQLSTANGHDGTAKLYSEDSGGVGSAQVQAVGQQVQLVSSAGADGTELDANPTGLVLNGTGAGGQLNLPNIPTADPHVVGQLWNASGTLKISAG